MELIYIRSLVPLAKFCYRSRKVSIYPLDNRLSIVQLIAKQLAMSLRGTKILRKLLILLKPNPFENSRIIQKSNIPLKKKLQVNNGIRIIRAITLQNRIAYHLKTQTKTSFRNIRIYSQKKNKIHLFYETRICPYNSLFKINVFFV